MKGYLTTLLALLSSCTVQVENMAKNNPKRGDTYSYVVAQVGGQVTAQSSMGTALAADNQKSFADLMQAAGAAYASWSTASVSKAQEITAQYKAGQITKQQAQAQMAAVQQAEIAAGVKKAKIPPTP